MLAKQVFYVQKVYISALVKKVQQHVIINVQIQLISFSKINKNYHYQLKSSF